MTDETTPGDDTPWLSATELESWVPLSGMLLGLVSALDAQLQSDAKVSFFGYLVLAGLSEAPGRTLPMSDLSVLAHGSLSRLSHAVSTLEKRGWVRRSPSPRTAASRSRPSPTPDTTSSSPPRPAMSRRSAGSYSTRSTRTNCARSARSRRSSATRWARPARGRPAPPPGDYQPLQGICAPEFLHIGARGLSFGHVSAYTSSPQM